MSSKRAQRRRACEGKRGFETIEDAKAAAREYALSFGDSLTPYRCRFCGRFHVGHPPKEVRQAIAARRSR
jgi:hypothetical protein